MKTKLTTPALAALLAIAVASSATSGTQAADAVITDITGTKTSVTGIRAHRHDSRGGGYYHWSGVPTETDTYSDSILLSLDGDLYRVEIPFDIIKTVTTREPDKKETLSRRSENLTVVLSDDTTLVGKAWMFDSINGKAELGEFTMPLDRIATISFSSPKTAYQAKPTGSRSGTLELSGTDKRILTGLGFVRSNENKNGCWLGYSTADSVRFVTRGDAKFDITWDKIREIRFAGSSGPTVLTASGQEFGGQMEDAAAIEGVTPIGRFQLHIRVPFNSTAKKLTVNDR